jgi:hypothetical protein
MACSDKKNPLVRSGLSQQQRITSALQNGYVNVDEREYADWIVFADKFSAWLNYYDSTNKVTGNWQAFFGSDISAILGSIAIQKIGDYQLAIAEKFNILKSEDAVNGVNVKKEALSSLVAAILTLAGSLDNYLQILPDGNDVKSLIQNLVVGKLNIALQKLLSDYKGAKQQHLIKEVDNLDWLILNRPVLKVSTLITQNLSPLWLNGAATLAEYYHHLPVDVSIYGDLTWTSSRKIMHAANHNLFSGLFDQFLMALSRLFNSAQTSLLQTLSNWDSHPAHYALFLTFLRLYSNAKDDANTLTQRHLDFYYKEVLQLKPNAAEPNEAHVLVQLANQVDAYQLPAGTLFKAGKDSLGKEVSYSLVKDSLFNKATIGGLMSVYKGTNRDQIGAVNNTGRLFAAPVINSADGLGAKLTSTSGEWHPYVYKTFNEGVLTSINMPKANIGFAIASHYLSLAEGVRLVNVRFAPALSAAQVNALSGVNASLTTAKGWYNVVSPVWANGAVIGGTTTQATTLTFTIPGDAPAIVNYNAKIHLGTFNVDAPVLKVYLNNIDTASYTYDLLKDINITTVEVEVKVGLDASDNVTPGGVKNLSLFGDSGVLDPSKPFMPFGPMPKQGDSMIIGNEEVFKKQNAQLQLQVEWKNLPEWATDIDFSPYTTTTSATGISIIDTNPKVNVFALNKGVWQSVSNNVAILSDFVLTWDSGGITISSNDSIITFPATLLGPDDGVFAMYDDVYLPYAVTANNGFIKLVLTDTFGFEEYQTQYTKYLIDQAKTPPTGTPGEPTKPYLPIIQSLTMHYKANTVSNVTSTSETVFDARDLHFFHLYPFGEAEEHTFLSNNSTVALMPQFKSTGTGEDIGEFYIGIQNIASGQSVSILFQVLEGTTDPTEDKPDNHVTWSYLSNNQWQAFTKTQVSDATNQLIQSGIISFIFPADANTDNTILPQGMVWIKAAVTVYPEAVCKLLSVDTQAAVVIYQPNGNAPDFMDTSLPAQTISKLRTADATIKKVTQPYASFGGRPTESDPQYYVRVSERLRHKDRAITIWDYEHMILQAFPSIHKVKCLNHTSYPDSNYNEVAPGYITIITIPDLNNRNDANPLRPYTNQNVLTDIETFLKTKVSCHVKLNARQPQFEEVRLKFNVKFFTGYEFNFYHDQLQQEITRFLTPWSYSSNAEIDFGGKVYKSVLINFIEERPYVDYITNVEMYQRVDDTSPESADQDEIIASTARSILVSAMPSKHAITEIITFIPLIKNIIKLTN